MVQPHQQRALDEESELRIKTEKLEAFLSSAIFKGLAAKEQSHFTQQLQHMKAYGEILRQRIQAFS